MLKRLRTVDKRFKIVLDRGKGSHRMLVRPTDTGERHYPFPCHSDGAEIGKNYLRDILRFFALPPDLFD